MLTLAGVLFTLFASSRKPRYKPDVEFDDLAAGLNIDLGFYVNDINNSQFKKRNEDEELSSLLIK